MYSKFDHGHFDDTEFDDGQKFCCIPAPECCICFESIRFSDMFVTKCKHMFHVGCINEWCKTKNSCPLCRSFPVMDIPIDCVPVIHNNNIIDNIIIYNTYINSITDYINSITDYNNNINNNINNIINNDQNYNINIINNEQNYNINT